MNTLAIVPVLGRNESIPKMFSRFLVKKPLFLHICSVIKKTKSIKDFYIFTDDDNIAHIAEINDIKVIKDAVFAKEFHDSDINFVFKILEKIEDIESQKYDYILKLMPNFPLINSDTIDKSIDDFILSNFNIGIFVKFLKNIKKSYWRENEEGLGIKIRDNDIKKKLNKDGFIELKGMILFKRKTLFQKESEKIKLLELGFPENLQIYNHIDWWIAEKFLQRKKIIIRVDGYDKIGLGHIYRMLSLAQKLLDHELLFVTKYPYYLGIKMIEEHNYKLKKFSTINEFEKIVDDFNPNIVINDILDTNLDYINFLKDKNIFVVNFEDLGDGTKLADLVINALYKRKNFEENHYWGKDYYILREEFQLIGQKKLEKEVKNILITYGGTDPNNYTKKVLDVINDLKLRKVKVNVILGLGYKHKEQLQQHIKKLHLKISIMQHINHISKYMYEADIAFTAAGRSVYELASIGTPTITLVENERGLMHTFANKENGIINVGLGYGISNKEIKNALITLINDFELRKKCNRLMLQNNLKSGIDNVISLIFSQYEKFESGLKK